MKNIKKVLSLVLALVMVLGLALPASAVEETQPVGFTKIDNGAVKADLSNRVADGETDEPQYSSSDVVRVSIVLEGASTIAAGYPTMGIAENADAMAYRATLEETQAQMTQRISQKVLGGKKLDVVWNMTLAANIISANVAYGKIDEIKAMDGVKDVFVETRYEPDVAQIGGDDPSMATSSEMIGSNTAYMSGYTGAGSRIAIVDTGTDTQHRSFDGEAFEYSLAQNAAKKGMTVEEYKESLNLLDVAEITAKLDKLNIADALAANGVTASDLYLTSKLPFGYNYVDGDLDLCHENDAEGEHGSHVAGIATANAYVKAEDGSFASALDTVLMQGVAPDAQLITMKVFGKGGGAYDSDYMVAIEDAILLDCDVVNLSLGSGNPGSSRNETYQDILDSFVTTDTVVCISAGNSGAWMNNAANGIPYLYNDDVSMATGGSPGSYTNSLGVASVDNIGTTGCFIKVGDIRAFYSETDYTNESILTMDTSADGTGTEYEYVYFTNTGADGDGNNMLTDYADIVKDKVVFVYRGTSSFYQKHMAVEEVGGVACIVCNNQAGTINMDLTDSTATIPCVSILNSDAVAIMEASTPVYAENGTDVLYYTGKLSIQGAPSSGIVTEDYIMSDFSSWGVPGSLELKPEITAPGGNIYSVGGTYYDGATGNMMLTGHASYENMSGTSMAAPQVTGMTALVAQYIRENKLDEKVSGMTTRALAQSLLMSTAEPVIEKDSGSWYSVMKQGAGVANVGNAVSAESYIKVDGQNDGKVKVELFDDPARDGAYSASFSINNLTEEALTYNLSADFFTQDIFPNEGILYLDTWTAALETVSAWTVDGVAAHPTADLTPYDFDGDGDTDKDDAQALMDFITGNREAISNAENADLSGNEAIDTADVYELLKLLSSTKVTVPAGGSVNVTVNFALTDAEKEFLNTYYTSGAYIEGYLFVTPDTSAEGVVGVSHSIPVFGFYGNWSDASMFDVGSLPEFWYGTEERLPYLPDGEGYPEMFTNYMTIRYAGDSGEYFYFGNPLTDDEAYLPERNAFNNEVGDTLYKYYFSVIRNAGNAKYVISDAKTGEVYMEEELGSVDAAFYYENGATWQGTQYGLNLGWKGTDAEGNKLPEGTTVKISLVLAPEYYENADGTYAWKKLGDGATLSTMTTIDNTAPEITGVYRSTTERKLVVTAKDNQYVSVIAAYDETGEKDLAFVAPNQTTPGEEQMFELDLTAVENERIIVTVYDYAMNVSTYKLILTEETHDEKTTSVTLNPTEMTLLVGNTGKITATVEPWIVTDPLTWTSSDDNVATVNAKGIVTAVGKGECVITATSVLSPEISATCNVTVETVNYTLNGLLQDTNGNPMSFTWNMETDKTWTKIANIEPSIGAAAIANDGNVYVMDAVENTWGTHKVNPLTGETITKGANAAIPYWDMTASKVFIGENDSDLLAGIYAGYLFVGQDPMAPAARGYNLASALTQYTGATWLTAIESAGYYYDEEEAAAGASGHAELYYALDNAGYIWLFEYTMEGKFYLFNFFPTDLKLDYPGYGDYLQCSMVEADDGSALFLSHFDGETNAIYMLELAQDAAGELCFVSTALGDVGQDVWPAPLTSVTHNVEGEGTAAASLAETVAKNADKLNVAVEKTEATKLAPAAKNVVKGGLNAVTVDVAEGEKPEDAGTATVKITADAAVNNGLYETTYDASAMEYVSAQSNVEIYSVNATEGKVVFGFASEEAIAEGTTLATLTFKNKGTKCDAEITVAEVEQGTAPETLAVEFSHTAVIDAAVAATCTETGLTEGSHCSVCGEVLVAQETVPALGHDMVIDVAVAPTCTESGYGAGCHCSRCDMVTVAQEVIAPLGHTAVVDAAVAATCTETGLTEGSHCSVCGEVLVAQETVPALGHTEVIDPAVEPTLESEGKTEGSHCSVCGEVIKAQEVIPALEDTTCYYKDFADCTGAWYHEAVDYTVSEGLMQGIGGGKFAPNGTMTRAMMVTVLYRMAGEPKVSGPSSFKDVPEGQWYSDAIAWAQDNGIVLGVLADKFAPNDCVTREQIATILWRYEGTPEAKADMTAFKDTDKISDYAADAMRWAVSEGIFKGDNGNLKPTDFATRAEFACMVMRYVDGSYACENNK